MIRIQNGGIQILPITDKLTVLKNVILSECSLLTFRMISIGTMSILEIIISFDNNWQYRFCRFSITEMSEISFSVVYVLSTSTLYSRVYKFVDIF